MSDESAPSESPDIAERQLRILEFPDYSSF